MTRDRDLTDETAARLLSGRDLPSVLAKERGFERVFARVAAEARPKWRSWQALVLGSSAAACVLLALLWRPRGSEFASRGEGLNEPSFRALCVASGESHCARGQALAFEVAPGPKFGFFAAFARRADGVIVWYFPAAGGVSLPLDGAAAPVLDRGIQLGAEQPPGPYELYGVFSAQPLSRAQIRAALGDRLESSPGVSVIRRRFEVDP